MCSFGVEVPRDPCLGRQSRFLMYSRGVAGFHEHRRYPAGPRQRGHTSVRGRLLRFAQKPPAAGPLAAVPRG
ncbi:hypothetical protein VPH35_123267 [Triticum aestivum]